MIETSPVKKVLLALAGLLLGLLLYSFYLLGGIMTFAGLIVERATVPVPQTYLDSRPADLEEQLLAFLGDVELGGMARIDEDSLNRLTESALARLPEDQPFRFGDPRIELDSAALDAELLMGFDPAEPPVKIGAFRLRPLATKLGIGLHAVPGDGGVLLTLKKLKVGRIELPMERLAAYLRDQDLSEFGFPLVKESSLAYTLPYQLLGASLPAALTLDGVEIRRDALAARLRVDSALQQDLLEQTAPLLREQGAALVAAVAAAFPEGEEELKAQVQSLAALGDPESLIPAEPSALVSYIENQVWAEPADGDGFYPELGGDLFAGTQLETGAASYIELILRDQSVLKLSENSRFLIEELPRAEEPRGRFALFSGAVRARVAKAFNPDYAIQTPSAVCGVRGTDLSIELADGRSLALSVLEGSVALIPESGPETRVEAGSQLRADRKTLRSGDLPSPRRIDSAEKDRLEAELAVASSPADADSIREERRFWLTVEGLKGVITRVALMEEEKREQLGAELEQRLDAEALDRSFNRLMENPEFAAMIESFGIEGIPYP